MTRHSDQFPAEDMEEVGRRLMDALHGARDSLNGWSPNDCPTEVVSDLINARDEVTAERDALTVSLLACSKRNGELLDFQKILKREVAAADAIVRIGDADVVVPSRVKAEIVRLRTALNERDGEQP